MNITIMLFVFCGIFSARLYFRTLQNKETRNMLINGQTVIDWTVFNTFNEISAFRIDRAER